ncbi:Leucine-rich repeat 3 [Sesbania bispinosa]|nr:Leucine-rich repeat 3 [Sesbania bispinosa]
MAYEIVRQESSEDPGRRSRLWDVDDINEVLEYDKGTRAIRSIQMHLLEIGNSKLKLSPYIFAKMSKLQFLDFYRKNDQDFFNLPKRLVSFPSELRYLRWKCYPMKSLPDNFSAAKLVILDLSGSKVQKLWDGVQKLNLGLCTSLITLTTYTHLCCLSDLNVGGCKDIREFSVTSENMIKLNLGGTCIKALPSTFGCQSKLEILSLTRSCIERLPSCIKNLTRLRCLDVRLCSEIQTIPELPLSLETLRAEKCKLLKTMLLPSAASEQFKENRKRVGFWNCLNLDEHSLMTIGLNVQINVIKFAYQHLSTQKHDHVENYDDYHDNYHSYQAMYVYPGSRIPDWFVC